MLNSMQICGKYSRVCNLKRGKDTYVDLKREKESRQRLKSAEKRIPEKLNFGKNPEMKILRNKE